MSIWGVIGGGDKGGIVVREGMDVSSAMCPERLSTGALIVEMELQGERVHYAKLTGTGPEMGWVSTKLGGGRDLLAKPEVMWEVVGGGDKGGIVVREGLDTASPMAPERLSTGALVKELASEGERVHYERITGAGPATGWVSTKLKDGRELLLKVLSTDWGAAALASLAALNEPAAQPAPPSGVTGPALELQMSNPEKDFSYEGLPLWVPWAAAVAKLKREGKPFLPTPDPRLERLDKMKSPGPFKKYPPKKLRELLGQTFPGAMFGVPVPRSAEQLASEQFGAEWLTKAMHAAGTLPPDNKVTKIVRVKELNMTGFQKEGGAAMKCFITVEYLNPDPTLHTELFAKYTWDPVTLPPGVNTLGQDDSLECLVSCQLPHLFPFRSPKFYWADVSRENSAYMIITEAIPYSKRGEQEEFEPYQILPGLGKCQDHLLPNPLEFYLCLFNAMGQLGAWDKLGRFDSIFGPNPAHDEATWLAYNQRPPQTMQTLESTRAIVGKTLDKEIDFLMNWCEKLAPPEVRNEETLQRVKSEILEMCPYFGDMGGSYQNANSDYIAANHANLQADNAWFWRDEYGDLSCGMLDWGGLARAPFAMRFTGCLSGAPAEILLAHIEGICQAYVDEYHRCGGPKVSAEEVLLRYHLAYLTAMYDLFRFVEQHVFEESPKEKFLTFTGPLDPEYQERFYTRCGSQPTINAFTYYIRKGTLKATFDEWLNGKGKPFLTQYS